MCWKLAAKVVADLKAGGSLVHAKDSRAAVLTLLQEEERRAIQVMRARGWWAELKELSPAKQSERVQAIAALQTGEMFEVILADAREMGLSDPYTGEHAALTAHRLLDFLAPERYPGTIKSDYKAEAMVVVANCRRIAGDWKGSRAALAAAENYLRSGTGDPLPEAHLLSIHASLSRDMGKLEFALGLLARASEIYENVGSRTDLAKSRVKEAVILLSATQAEEALRTAEGALRLLGPRDVRLEMLARSLITECFLVLGRLPEALRSLDGTRPFYEQYAGGVTSLKVSYLEARMLDALGCVREAEKLYRDAAHGFAEAEIYKDAFIVKLALFESFVRRDALDKATRLCKEAIDLLEQTSTAHAQMIQVWRDLLRYTATRAIKLYHVAEVRDYLVRHWASPAPHPPLSRSAE